MKRKVAVFVFGLALLSGTASVALSIALSVYSDRQLSVDQPRFATPEIGMVELYGGPDRAVITGIGKEGFSNLYYVGAVVESEICKSGQTCPGGSFFLKTDSGWVQIPEGRFPHLVAAGQKISSLFSSAML
ncbi:MAG: hypothetical protein ACRD1R_18790 [Acidobacteriota bacterium]